MFTSRTLDGLTEGSNPMHTSSQADIDLCDPFMRSMVFYIQDQLGPTTPFALGKNADHCGARTHDLEVMSPALNLKIISRGAGNGVSGISAKPLLSNAGFQGFQVPQI